MKQILTNLLFIYVLLCPSFCLAYKEQTHRRLSQEAVEASVLKTDSNVLEDLGLKPFDAPDQFRNYRNDPRNISQLVQDGAAFEDVPGPRVRHHFYNPRTGRPANSCGVEHGYTSPDWALEDREEIRGIGPTRHQDDSFADTRQFFLNALTNPVEDERERAWGRTFQGLGQVIHHLEDMTQPQHVRNDMHVVSGLNPPYDPCTGDPSWYEDYTESDGLPFLFYGGYPPVYGAADTTTFNTPRRFWDTEDGKGIAEYTNRNFVSAGTNFDQPNALEHPLPETGAEWAEDKTALCQEISQENNIPLPTGFAGQALPCLMTFNSTYVGDSYRPGRNALNKRTSTHSLFTADLRAFNEDGIQSYTLNKFNFFEAYQFLIPRAVGYSAGLINYFFRGKLEMKVNPHADGYLITNKGTEDIEGTFTLYYDSEDGTRYPVPEATWPTTAATGQGSVLSAGEAMPVPLFAPPLSPLPKTPGQYMLVFTGRMGEERPIQEAVGAVAATQVKLPYPSFLLVKEGGTYRSKYLDQGWERIGEGGVWFASGQAVTDKLVYASEYRSVDGGRSFTPLEVPPGPWEYVGGMTYVGGKVLVGIATAQNQVGSLISTDLGESWTWYPDAANLNLYLTLPYHIGERILFSGTEQWFSRSEDQGKTWQSQTITVGGVVPGNPPITEAGGVGWVSRTIVWNQRREDHVLLALGMLYINGSSGGGSNELLGWDSGDGAAERSKEPGAFPRQKLHNGIERGWRAQSGDTEGSWQQGVWKSVDGGNTWYKVETGSGLESLYWAYENKIALAPHGQALLATRLGTGLGSF
ncbi:MAG: hypothetical protein HOP18_17815 [Deltaproteobacteria bacterium]|nr:hypothetical protein [Deltaproteobacteria bacterium]